MTNPDSTKPDARIETIANAVAFAFFAGDPSPKEAAQIIATADPYTSLVPQLQAKLAEAVEVLKDAVTEIEEWQHWHQGLSVRIAKIEDLANADIAATPIKPLVTRFVLRNAKLLLTRIGGAAP